MSLTYAGWGGKLGLLNLGAVDETSRAAGSGAACLTTKGRK